MGCENAELIGKEEKMNEYKVVLMCTTDTVQNVKKYNSILSEFLEPKAIVVVGARAVGKIIEEEKIPVEFLDEDNLYPGMTFQTVKQVIEDISDSDIKAVKRTGWYFQQFLKMAYCMRCEGKNYLIWDADTIPLHPIKMVNNAGQYYFDVKTEYNKAYFTTLHVLFTELKKSNEYSFIAEHMLIDTEIMRELLGQIEKNSELCGENFWDKILRAIATEDLANSGFSEFETYGTYVEQYHKEEYQIRKWRSLREGTMFYGSGITRKQMEYLEREYNAISFERHDTHRKIARLLNRRIFQKLWIMGLLETIKGLKKEQ